MGSDAIEQLRKMMTVDEAERLALDHMTAVQHQALLDWALRVYEMGQHVVGDIEQIKYDGRLIVLTDGSRWMVDSTDALTAEMWCASDRVVVIEGEMFRLDDLERVQVEEEIA